MNDQLAREACAWVPRMQSFTLLRVLANLHLYMESNGVESPFRPGDPIINGYKVLDDGGGSGHYQIRVEGIKLAVLKRIVGHDIEVTWELQETK